MTNILVIHGGNIYSSHESFVEQLKTKEVDLERMKPKTDWKANLERDLEGEFNVFLPSMPLRDNADYELWKIWFERVLEKLETVPIIIGHSLGAMFLAKYYSENIPETPVNALLLVAPEYLTPDVPERGESNFVIRENISELTKSAKNVTFFHSEDDMVVPFASHAAFKKAVPGADFVTFPNKGHFTIEHFPEIVQVIKRLV